MMTLNNHMEKSFRSVMVALDALPAEGAQDFLARLVLILASELKDSDRFEQAVQRANIDPVNEVSA